MTGKKSIRELTDKEYKDVYGELVYRTKISSLVPPQAKNKKSLPSGITKAQISRIWALMYELESYDTVKSEKSLGERLCSIIKKELHIDCFDNRRKKDSIFTWLSNENAAKLIEVIKKYILSAKRRHSGGG